jgi:hypothetical protein
MIGSLFLVGWQWLALDNSPEAAATKERNERLGA